MKLEIYRCNVCGNIVNMLTKGGGTLVCCGKPMQLLEPNSTEANPLTHKPVIENNHVKVGAQTHPMLPAHHIMWLAIKNNDELIFKFLQPDEIINYEIKIGNVDNVLAYCNIHSLWQK